MAKRSKRDYLILELLFPKREMSFSDFEKAGIMAKSTLNDHLRGLIQSKEVRKAVGKTPNHLDRLVYVITAKGRRTYVGKRDRGPDLEDFF